MSAAQASRGPALVTGAARRIGRALALEAASLGYDVAIHCREADADSASLAAEISTEPQAYAKIQRGPVTIYEWPAFASPPKTLDEERAFWSCVRFFDYARPLPDGRPRVTKLGFGEDGVWHYFWSEG